MFFGEYLLERGLVNSDRILDALEIQYKRRIPLGRLAIREGIMSVDQVLKTLVWSREADVRFGVTAINAGYLEEGFLVHLLRIQQVELPRLGDILVDMGAIDRPTMKMALTDFERLKVKN